MECVHVLREKTLTPGLFRVAGSVTRQQEMRVCNNDEGSKVIFLSLSQSTLEVGDTLTSPNVHDVASILKQFLRELPTPLIPPSLGPALQWVWSGKMKELLLCVLLQLPQPHLKVRGHISHSQQELTLLERRIALDKL